MASIKDVANLAGLSPAVVSKYLKNPKKVRNDTRERIESAIQQLNYIPNAAARALRTGRTNMYLVMISNLKDPAFADLFNALNEAANRRHFQLLIQTAKLEDGADMNEDINFYTPSLQQVDGIIIMLARNPDILDNVRTLPGNIPVVTFGWPKACPGLDTVAIDIANGFYEVTKHLIEQGHQRIAFISDHPKNSLAVTDKVDGYLNALTEYGYEPVQEYIITVTPQFINGYNAAERLMTLKNPPTAIVCETDLFAAGCIKYAAEHNIHVPSQLAVTGSDNTFLSEIFVPPITSLDFPIRQMAETCFDMLSLRRKNPAEASHCVVYHPQLILRESTSHSTH